eukprot:scpid98673/ scgid35616/ 
MHENQSVHLRYGCPPVVPKFLDCTIPVTDAGDWCISATGRTTELQLAMFESRMHTLLRYYDATQETLPLQLTQLHTLVFKYPSIIVELKRLEENVFAVHAP